MPSTKRLCSTLCIRNELVTGSFQPALLISLTSGGSGTDWRSEAAGARLPGYELSSTVKLAARLGLRLLRKGFKGSGRGSAHHLVGGDVARDD